VANRATAAYILPHLGALVAVLTDSPAPRQYWSVMKQRVQDEGFTQLLTKCVQLKMCALDGKRYATDAADVETMLRIIQARD
jgi:hypothetical protein